MVVTFVLGLCKPGEATQAHITELRVSVDLIVIQFIQADCSAYFTELLLPKTCYFSYI